MRLLYLESDLLKVFRKWCIGTATGYKKRVNHDRLVSRDDYYAVYESLKERHMHWAKEWTEKTDPTKFVFEDIGIAAYLITLWNKEHPDR